MDRGSDVRETSADAAPAIVVRLPGILVDLFPGSRRRVEMRAASVAEMVDELDLLWPGFGNRSRDEQAKKNPARRPGFLSGLRGRAYAASSCSEGSLSSLSALAPRFGPLLRLASIRRTASVSDILLTAAISRAMRSRAAS